MADHETLNTHDAFRSIIAGALAEDIGAGDITSTLLIPEEARAEMRVVAQEGIIACGAFLPGLVFEQLDAGVRAEAIAAEGEVVPAGGVLAKAEGSARALLAGERVALNLMQRACGVATLTHVYVEAVKGTKAVILDTRKTMPGLRALDKYAVWIGGGRNHRMGLYDAVLIKDNHIGIGDWGLGIRDIIIKARDTLPSLMPNPQSPIPIIIECDTLAQVAEAVEAEPDRILLDNMDVATLREAVALAAGRVKLEASGGVTLGTVRAVAETGVDYISVGALTHSVPAADIGAEMAYR